jgi:hypothetical protein
MVVGSRWWSRKTALVFETGHVNGTFISFMLHGQFTCHQVTVARLFSASDTHSSITHPRVTLSNILQEAKLVTRVPE